MKIKKWIKICIKIAVVVLAVMFLNRLFMPKYVSENQDGRVSEEFYQEKLPVDVIFTGSSTVYNDVSTITLWQEFGITSFVRANASQTMWQSYYLLEDSLSVQTPELAVLDVSFMKYADEFAEEPSNRKIMDGMRFSKSKLDCIRASMYEGEHLVEYLLPIFRFHDRWRELTAEDFIYCFAETQVTYNGYLPSFEVQPADKGPWEQGGKDSYEFGRKSVEYLERAIKLCQENDVQVLLIKTPCYRSDWYPQYDENVGEIAAKYGVNYINFENRIADIGLDFTIHTNDGGGHLNAVGAELFTGYLGSILREEYALSDHRQDPAYASVWEQKTARYEKEKEAGMETYWQCLKELKETE